MTWKRKIIFNEISPKRTIILKVYENKLSYYGVVLDAHTKEPIMSASFREADGDMSIYRITEYFNFYSF